jgi:riboflavin synthase
MFTGIIEEIGTIKAIHKGRISASLAIKAEIVTQDLKIGDSVNTNGACLTVTSFNSSSFTVDVMAETMRKTNLSMLSPGAKVNLERALKLSDRLGGHMVSGHIDGTGEISEIFTEENATWFRIHTENEILKYIIKKGSVAIDGISLTVAEVEDHFFKVSIIPHTADETTLLQKKVGSIVNIENDMTAKYIERFLIFNNKNAESKIDMDFLKQNGFID